MVHTIPTVPSSTKFKDLPPDCYISYEKPTNAMTKSYLDYSWTSNRKSTDPMPETLTASCDELGITVTATTPEELHKAMEAAVERAGNPTAV